MKAVDDPKMANNRVLASVAQQALVDGVEQPEAVRLYGWLIKYAWIGREASSTITHIRAVLELRQPLDEIPPDVALVALRLRSQFGFGIKLLDSGWGRRVESRFSDAFVLPLQKSVFEFEKTGVLPDGCTFGDLIDRCDVLVEYRRSLGHNLDYPELLKVKIELVQKQLKALPDRIDLNATCVVDICDLVNLRAQLANSRKDWEPIFSKWLPQAYEYFTRIRKLDENFGKIYLALLQAFILRFMKDGRKYFPEVENWGDDWDAYCKCAEALGNILAEHDHDPEDSTVSRMVRRLPSRTKPTVASSRAGESWLPAVITMPRCGTRRRAAARNRYTHLLALRILLLY